MAVVNNAINFGLSDANDIWSLFTDENSPFVQMRHQRKDVQSHSLETSFVYLTSDFSLS